MSMTLKTTKNTCCGLSVVFKITTRRSTIDVRKKSDLSRKNRTTGSPGHVRKIWDWPQPGYLEYRLCSVTCVTWRTGCAVSLGIQLCSVAWCTGCLVRPGVHVLLWHLVYMQTCCTHRIYNHSVVNVRGISGELQVSNNENVFKRSSPWSGKIPRNTQIPDT